MEETAYDKFLLYMYMSSTSHKGITDLHVDDCFGHGTKSFLDLEDEKCKRFQQFTQSQRIYFEFNSSVRFNGSTITKLDHGKYKIDQTEKLKLLIVANSDKDLISNRALLQYIGTCKRPDFCSLSQRMAIDVLNPSRLVYTRLNKLVKWARTTMDMGLNFINLDQDPMTIKLYKD